MVTPQLPRSQQKGWVSTSSWQLSLLQQLQSSQGGQPCGQRGSWAGWRPGGAEWTLLCFLLPLTDFLVGSDQKPRHLPGPQSLSWCRGPLGW